MYCSKATSIANNCRAQSYARAALRAEADNCGVCGDGVRGASQMVQRFVARALAEVSIIHTLGAI